MSNMPLSFDCRNCHISVIIDPAFSQHLWCGTCYSKIKDSYYGKYFDQTNANGINDQIESDQIELLKRVHSDFTRGVKKLQKDHYEKINNEKINNEKIINERIINNEKIINNDATNGKVISEKNDGEDVDGYDKVKSRLNIESFLNPLCNYCNVFKKLPKGDFCRYCEKRTTPNRAITSYRRTGRATRNSNKILPFI